MGKPAAVEGNSHTCPHHIGGRIFRRRCRRSRVLIGRRRAARVTDKCNCTNGPPDAITQGADSVLIDGKSAATLGSTTAQGGKITEGCRKVLIGDNKHHSQEQKNSCVVASVRNMIESMTGEDIPESTLRDEMRAIMGKPRHNFNHYGVLYKYAAQLLEKRGIANTTRTWLSLDQLASLTVDKPVLLGFKYRGGHYVMLEQVKNIGGRRTFIVRDPNSSFGGKAREMTDAEFGNLYHPRAEVIIPKCSCET